MYIRMLFFINLWITRLDGYFLSNERVHLYDFNKMCTYVPVILYSENIYGS